MGIGFLLVIEVILIEAVSKLLFVKGQSAVVVVVDGGVENFAQFSVTAIFEICAMFAISMCQGVTRCNKIFAVQVGVLIASEIGGIDNAV